MQLTPLAVLGVANAKIQSAILNKKIIPKLGGKYISLDMYWFKIVQVSGITVCTVSYI
jgi:hypothetical protein